MDCVGEEENAFIPSALQAEFVVIDTKGILSTDKGERRQSLDSNKISIDICSLSSSGERKGGDKLLIIRQQERLRGQ